MTLVEFRRAYPAAVFTLSGGKPFTYRYYKNPNAKATLALLTGGIGLSDLFYKHFARFAKDFSVLTFDYQIQFADNGEFADAVAELLCRLKEKVLAGRPVPGRRGGPGHRLSTSGGGGRAGAFQHLFLAKDMGDEASSHLKKMMESQKKSKKLLSVLPFSLFKRLMKWVVMKKKTDGFTQREKAVMEELCGAMLELLTKPYEYHMIDFLCDRGKLLRYDRAGLCRVGRQSPADPVRGRYHFQSSLQGFPNRHYAASYRCHQPDRRASGADGPAGAVCRSGDRVYSKADIGENTAIIQNPRDRGINVGMQKY